MDKNRDWFLYTDRKESPYNPLDTMVITNNHWIKEKGSMDSKEWIKEGWLTQAALVPRYNLKKIAKNLPSLDTRDFDPGWANEKYFNFGEHVKIAGITLYPWIDKWENPINEDLKINLRRDFIIYHGLEERNELEYYHPIDQVKVAKVVIEEEEFQETIPKVSVHINYLRDFLSVKKMGLLICVLADRFANIPQESMFDIEEVNYKMIGEYTWITINVFSPEDLKPYYRRRPGQSGPFCDC